MPFLDPLHPLSSTIIEILAHSPGRTLAELRTKLETDKKLIVSVPNLYRTVSRMVENQILVKAKKKLSLNMVWVSHVTRLSDTMKRSYLQSGADSIALPEKDGEMVTFTAESLLELDPVWNHVLVKRIAQSEEAEGLLEFSSHPYFVLGKTDTESRFYQSFTGKGIPCRLLLGNQSFLDTLGEKMAALEGVKALCTDHPPFPKEGYVLSIWGDTIVDCIFPEALTRYFSFFFQNVKASEDFDAALFTDVFHMKASCKLNVWKNAKESALMREKLLPFLSL